MTDGQFSEEVKAIIKAHQPKVKFVQKKKMLSHRVLAKLLFFVDYWNFSSTTGWTVALADRHARNWNVIGHEGVHVLQAKRQTRLVHSFLYAFPQVLAVLGIALPLILWNPWWLLLLLLALPLPAYFRYRKELEAYKHTVIFRQWRYGSVPHGYIMHMAEQFCNKNYWFMWPFKKRVYGELYDAVLNAKIWGPTTEYQEDVYDALDDSGLLSKGATI